MGLWFKDPGARLSSGWATPRLNLLIDASRWAAAVMAADVSYNILAKNNHPPFFPSV